MLGGDQGYAEKVYDEWRLGGADAGECPCQLDVWQSLLGMREEL